MESLFLGGPKARQLVPHITFVNFDPMLFAQQPELILIVALRMVQFLILDVALDFVKVGITHRKYSLTGLPRKAMISSDDIFRPFGSFCFDDLNQFANL
jgi:hypothetical protein